MSQPLVTRFGADPLLDPELATKRYVDNQPAGQTFARIVKKLDEAVTNDIVLQDDDELFVALNADKVYGGYLMMFFDAATNADMSYACSVPAGATAININGDWQGGGFNQGTADFTTSRIVATSGTGTIVAQALGFRIIVAGTAGNFQFQWAQGVAQATATNVRQGSYLVIWEETA